MNVAEPQSNFRAKKKKPTKVKFTDKRLQPRATEVCRCCGSDIVHTRKYNDPTMLCILYYRDIIKTLKQKQTASIKYTPPKKGAGK